VKIGWTFWGGREKLKFLEYHLARVQFWLGRILLFLPSTYLPLFFSALSSFFPYQFDSQVCHWSLWKLACLNDLFLYGITVYFLKSLIESIQNINCQKFILFKLLGRGK
jgi:hypothetical protein